MQLVDDDIEFVEQKRDCSYFDDEISDIRYRYLQNCRAQEYQKMLERGWRRFGKMHFVPECADCTKCISMRIDVANYKFSKSEKRVMAKNKDTKLYVQAPTLSLDHLSLYDKYHAKMSEKKGWSYSPIEPVEYNRSYCQGKSSYSKEFLYFRNNKLVAVALTDVLSQSMSSIYCYYDHEYEEISLGKFSILAQIKVAKELKIPYIYLGYWIKEHQSMGYKINYKPFEVLKNRPRIDEEPIWEKYEL